MSNFVKAKLLFPLPAPMYGPMSPSGNFSSLGMNLWIVGLESKSLSNWTDARAGVMNDGPKSVILSRNLCLHDITNSPGANSYLVQCSP